VRFANDRAVNPDKAYVAHVQDISIPVGNGRAVPVRLYSVGKSAEPQPVFLYLHGGGWIGGSVETHDHVARQLAVASGILIASMDYPLAPEDPFPEAPRQCVEVVRWLNAHGNSVGADGNRIAIGGDSAGANISMGSLLALRDSGESLVRYGVLVYGSYTTVHDLPSHRTLGDGRFGLTHTSLGYYWNHYLGANAGHRRNPMAAPLEGAMHGLPPLFLIAAGLDPVRDETRQLAARLVLAGQTIRYQEYAGLVHGFMHYYGQVPAAAEAIATIGEVLRRELA